MTANQLLLAAEMLEEASDKFANHSCNDWEWPKDWDQIDRLSLIYAMEDSNYDRSLVDKYGPPDWLVMSTLASMLRREAAEVKDAI